MVRAFGLSGVLMVGVGRRVAVVGEVADVGCDFGETLPSGFDVDGGSMPDDFDDARRKRLNRDSLRPDEGFWGGGRRRGFCWRRSCDSCLDVLCVRGRFASVSRRGNSRWRETRGFLIRDRIVCKYINVSKKEFLLSKRKKNWNFLRCGSLGTQERGRRGVLGLALFPERHIYPTLIKIQK